MNEVNKKEKLVQIMIKLVIAVIALILLFLSVMALAKTAYFDNTYATYNEKIFYKPDNIVINLIGFSLGVAIIYSIYNLFLILHIKNKYIFIILSALYVVASVTWVVVTKSPLRADSRVIEMCASDFINGNYKFLERGQYLFHHPLQLGIVLAMELVYKIAGFQNPIIFKFLNILCSLIAIGYLYKISELIFKNEKVQKILMILLAGCFILVFFNVLVYGNIAGLMFGVIAIYYTLKYLDDKKKRYLLFIIISMILAIVLKSNYQVYMIGISIALILDLFKKFRVQNIIAIIIMVIFAFSYSTVIIKYMEKRTGLEIGKGIPMISYIHMGMARPVDRASGWYNIDVNVEKTFIQAGLETEKASEISKEEIKKRIKDMINTPVETLKFYYDKILSTWIEPAFQTIWTSEPQEQFEEVSEKIAGNKILISIFDGKLNKVLLKYLDLFDILIFISTAFYCVTNFKNIGNKEFLLLVIFLGGFLFHILWETKSIYVIPYFVLLLPYAAAGIYELIKIINKITKKEEGKLLSDGSN